jgi:hypothetical protein
LPPLTAEEKFILEKASFNAISTRFEKFLYSVYRYLPPRISSKKRERWVQVLKQAILS